MALVSGATATLPRYAHTGLFGRLVTPATGNRVDSEPPLPWAADNGAFAGFDGPAFLRMLDRDDLVQHKPTCLFVACPDAVGDADATAALFASWRREIADRGYPVAFVLQDGVERQGVPWDELDAVFVGGTTSFKLGPVAERLVREALARGKWAHIGRVNSVRRIRRFQSMGADSFDGTAMSMFPDVFFERFLPVLANHQTGLDLT